MRNLMRNVSHKLRCAPFSTVNFARKPRTPVSGATISSAGRVLVRSATMSILQPATIARCSCLLHWTLSVGRSAFGVFCSLSPADFSHRYPVCSGRACKSSWCLHRGAQGVPARCECHIHSRSNAWQMNGEACDTWPACRFQLDLSLPSLRAEGCSPRCDDAAFHLNADRSKSAERQTRIATSTVGLYLDTCVQARAASARCRVHQPSLVRVARVV